MDPTLDQFMARLVADPHDDEARQVLRDWFIDQGQASVAEWLRLERLQHDKTLSDDDLTAFQTLKLDVDPAIRARLARTPIEPTFDAMCQSSGDTCPKRWEHLTHTDDPLVRRCETCKREVQFVESTDEANARLARRQVVAITPSTPRSAHDLHIPPPPNPPPPTRPDEPIRTNPPPPFDWDSHHGGLGTAGPNPPPPDDRPWWKRLLGWD